MSKKQCNPNPPTERPVYGKARKLSIFSFSITEIENAFTEWERRYREKPEQFISADKRLSKKPVKVYGAARAQYFLELVDKIKKEKK